MGYLVESQVPIQIEYNRTLLPATAYKADLLVENSVIIELKALTQMNGDCIRQLLTYLKLADKRLGYLINFGAKSLDIGNLKEDDGLQCGIYRLVNNF